MSKNTLEAVMGTFVLIVTTFLLIFAYNHTSYETNNGVVLTANFDSADGITVGTDVRMNGIKVGIVKDMTLDTKDYLAKLTLLINQGVPVPADSSAQVASEGLLGGRFIALVAGGEDTILKSGDQIAETQSAVSLEALIGKFIFSANGDKKDQDKDGKDAKSNGQKS